MGKLHKIRRFIAKRGSKKRLCPHGYLSYSISFSRNGPYVSYYGGHRQYIKKLLREYSAL